MTTDYSILSLYHCTVMIGFEQSTYTVDETDGSVEVCAIVVTGDKQPTAIFIVFTPLTTESDTTTGKFVYSLYIYILYSTRLSVLASKLYGTPFKKRVCIVKRSCHTAVLLLIQC